MSLAIYCSSWTFFGGVGSAATGGWNYLAIYLGPILLYLFGARLLTRLVHLSQVAGSTSIADFISARYGRSPTIAAIVAGFALIASIPYIALQLRSVSSSFGTLVGLDHSQWLGPLIAALLAAFAISFGARRYGVAGRHDGVIAAIAGESVIKLVSFLALGLFAGSLLLNAPPETQARGIGLVRQHFGTPISIDFFVQMLLGATAILCLPRQFFVAVTEAGGEEPTRGSRLSFVLYLVLISAMVLPLAAAGLSLLPAGAPADLIVLALPLSEGAHWLALLAFLGGFSAATAMVIAETIALSTMAANDLIAPLLLRHSRAQGEADLGRLMLDIRRLVIVAIIGAAFIYSEAINESSSLASIGLIAFAGAAQFAPALVATVLLDFRDARAAMAGLLGGLFSWTYCLLLPSIGSGRFASVMASLSHGLLDPRAPLGIHLGTPLTTGTLWSLGINIALMIGMRVSGARKFSLQPVRGGFGNVRTLGELKSLVARFVGEAEAIDKFGVIRAGPNRAGDPNAPITSDSARLAERLIAGVIGAPSARLIVTSTMAGATLDVGDVVRLLDEGGQSLQFSRGLLAATLQAIDPGVSVVDSNLRLVAWNPRYLEMFEYPEGYVAVGRPVADLIRYNAERGECGPGEVEAHVERRLGHLRRALPHSFERKRPSGRWIKTVGKPMPGAGYVMSFTDITSEKEAQAELEARVIARTSDLAHTNIALDEARNAAERATRDKTRFLAAASHDLLQPLHAARLFLTALAQETSENAQPLVRNIDRAISSADTLLRALLDVSKLDAGGVKPIRESFALGPLIDEIVQEFAPLAAERGLDLHSHAGAFSVETDRSLLRSILQNFLSNAVRYTPSGRIWIGARRRGDNVLIEVRDTGPGIAEADQQRIFREFERLESKGSAGGGVGLGLAIVERIARLLGHPLSLRSAAGTGATFAVYVPAGKIILPLAAPLRGTDDTAEAIGLDILCLDNDINVLAALEAALRARGHRPLINRTSAEALACAERERPAAALIDLHLGEARDGLDVASLLQAADPTLRIAIVTADRDVEQDPRLADLDVTLLPKPIEPGRLWQFLASAG